MVCYQCSGSFRTFKKYLLGVPSGCITVTCAVVVHAEFPYGSADITFVPFGITSLTVSAVYSIHVTREHIPLTTASSIGKVPSISASMAPTSSLLLIGTAVAIIATLPFKVQTQIFKMSHPRRYLGSHGAYHFGPIAMCIMGGSHYRDYLHFAPNGLIVPVSLDVIPKGSSATFQNVSRRVYRPTVRLRAFRYGEDKSK